MGIFGGSNSIFNDPGQLVSGAAGVFGGGAAATSSVFDNAWGYINGLFNPSAPATQAPPAPPNASAVAGASLQQTVGQEAQQFSASTLLNGGGGLPMGGSPITASNILRSGTR